MAQTDDPTLLAQRVRQLEAEVQGLEQEVRRLRGVNQRWAQLAGTDRLTGLPNKISLLRALVPQDIQHAQVAGDPVGCILLSGDNLGLVNENLGRDAGDQVIRGLSDLLQSILRGEERLGHIDGTHFAVVFYPATLEQTRERAEELLRRDLGFRQVRVRHHDSIARIEVDAADLPQLVAAPVRERVVSELTRLGYSYVTVDLGGFRSGSMNEVLEKVADESANAT